MKYVLITHNANNLGDVAILEATIQHIYSTDNNPTITLESNNVVQSRKQFPALNVVDRLFPTSEVKHSKKTFSAEFILKNIPFLFMVFWRIILAKMFVITNKKRSRISILTELKNADIVLSIAGDSIAPQYAWYLRFFEISIIAGLKKKLVLYAQSIGPFSGKQVKYANKYLSIASLILARDQKTFDLMHEYGVTTRIEKTADTVISLKPKENEITNRAIENYKVSEKTVGVVIRTSLYSGIPDEEYERYLCGMADVIKYLIEQQYQPLFISTISEDTIAAENFLNRFGFDIQVCDLREYLPSEVKTILSKFVLVISPRMHPIILSSTMGTPVIGLGKEFKMQSYLKLINEESSCIPMIPFNSEAVQDLIGKAIRIGAKRFPNGNDKSLLYATSKSESNRSLLEEQLLSTDKFCNLKK